MRAPSGIESRRREMPSLSVAMPVRHDQQFWFALAAFVPDAEILD